MTRERLVEIIFKDFYPTGYSVQSVEEYIRSKIGILADFILAELAKEKSEKPNNPAGLVEELREWNKSNPDPVKKHWDEILSRYGARKEVEVASDKGLQRICGGSGAWWEYKGKRGRLVFIEEDK